MGKDQENQTESENQESTSTESGMQESDSQAQDSKETEMTTNSEDKNHGETESSTASQKGNPQRVQQGEGTKQETSGATGAGGTTVVEGNTGEKGTAENPSKVEPTVPVPGSGESQQSESSETKRTGFRFQPSYRRKDPA